MERSTFWEPNLLGAACKPDRCLNSQTVRLGSYFVEKNQQSAASTSRNNVAFQSKVTAFTFSSSRPNLALLVSESSCHDAAAGRGGGGAAAGKRSGGWNSRSRCTCALGCPAGRRRLLLLSVYALLHVYSMSSARRRGAAVTIGLCLSLCLNQSICICLPFSTLNRCTCIPLYLSPCRSLSNPRDPTCSLAVFVASL